MAATLVQLSQGASPQASATKDVSAAVNSLGLPAEALTALVAQGETTVLDSAPGFDATGRVLPVRFGEGSDLCRAIWTSATALRASRRGWPIAALACPAWPCRLSPAQLPPG